jgi:hypothetical protein
MRSASIYILATALAVTLIWGVIRFGNRLSAPPALPDSWLGSIAKISPQCELPVEEKFPLTLSQSGESLGLRWDQSPYWELHGKMDREGKFRLAGRFKWRRQPNCRRIRMVWEGRIIGGEMLGKMLFTSEYCSICPEGIELTARPQTREEPGINEAPRSKAARYQSEILRSQFSSPSSPQKTAGYSAKENK